MTKRIVILTGAGISAESGIQTFRGADGLWEGHNVMDVASPQGWRKDRELVLKFYNDRRRQLLKVKPNAAHLAITELQKEYDVFVVTQNVDDLHERAGNKNVLHLHGQLRKARSTVNSNYVVDWDHDITTDDLDKQGNQMRPHIVWFGEDVPLLDDAVKIVRQADFVWIIGTSMKVYPAASLVNFASEGTPVIYVDPFPQVNHELGMMNFEIIEEKASIAIPALVNAFLKQSENQSEK
ncbi:NAD-dependent deacylase [Saprospiraceae bacterium]|nr:NAD-dependent deacylase [Saprospiraceae bacterium]